MGGGIAAAVDHQARQTRLDFITDYGAEIIPFNTAYTGT
jgi:hypothetical protein